MTPLEPVLPLVPGILRGRDAGGADVVFAAEPREGPAATSSRSEPSSSSVFVEDIDRRPRDALPVGDGER